MVSRKPDQDRNLIAWGNAERVAELILEQERYSEIREQIINLFTNEKMGSAAITRLLHNEEPLNGRSLRNIETATSAVRIVVNKLVDRVYRLEIIKCNNMEHIKIIENAAIQGRRESMKKRGFFVFEPKENDFFWEVAIRDTSALSSRADKTLNHTRIAEIMNEHFQTTRFTSQVCQRKFMSRKGIPTGHDRERVKK